MFGQSGVCHTVGHRHHELAIDRKGRGEKQRLDPPHSSYEKPEPQQDQCGHKADEAAVAIAGGAIDFTGFDWSCPSDELKHGPVPGFLMHVHRHR